ncbi:hypothetical protein DMN91_001965, partial [Ooceraea biroi]
LQVYFHWIISYSSNKRLILA